MAPRPLETEALLPTPMPGGPGPRPPAHAGGAGGGRGPEDPAQGSHGPGRPLRGQSRSSTVPAGGLREPLTGLLIPVHRLRCELPLPTGQLSARAVPTQRLWGTGQVPVWGWAGPWVLKLRGLAWAT